MNISKIILLVIQLVTSYPLLLNLIAEILEKFRIPLPRKLSEILFIPKSSEFTLIVFFYLVQLIAFIAFSLHWYFYQRDNTDIIKTQGYSLNYLLGILIGQILFCIPIFFLFKKLQKFIM